MIRNECILINILIQILLILFKLYIYLIDYQSMWVFLIFGWGAEKGCRIVRIVTELGF